jgi:phosphotriesterase-related protein
MVNSVLGPIDSSDLGFTLMHEHIVCKNSSMEQAFPDWFNRQDTLSHAISELRYAKQHGLQTIVDATPINLGRDIRLLKEVSEKTGVNIIASTGFFHIDEQFLYGWNIENLVEQLIPEVEEGIQGTDIKPGIIKCASAKEITPTNEKLLRVAARLHKQCKIPIITHSSSRYKSGIPQLEVLLDEGVESGKLVIGHCGDTTDMVYLETLLASGCYIGLDRFGIESVLPTDSRIDVCVELLEKGYEDQIVISQDYIVFLDMSPKKHLFRKRFASDKPWSFHYILVDIIPKLIDKGVEEKQIKKLTNENPKKILC